jgi:hypothetical protein
MGLLELFLGPAQWRWQAEEGGRKTGLWAELGNGIGKLDFKFGRSFEWIQEIQKDFESKPKFELSYK